MDKEQKKDCNNEERRKSKIHSFCNKIYTAHVISTSS